MFIIYKLSTDDMIKCICLYGLYLTYIVRLGFGYILLLKSSLRIFRAKYSHIEVWYIYLSIWNKYHSSGLY